MSIFSLIFTMDTDGMTFEEKEKRYLLTMVFIFLIFSIVSVIAYFLIDIHAIFIFGFVIIPIFFYYNRLTELYREYHKTDKIIMQTIIITFVTAIVVIIATVIR